MNANITIQKPINVSLNAETATIGADIHSWLSKQTAYQWLLAHAYDGVVWGKRTENGQWRLSSGYESSPALHTNTLLELRLFSPTAELFVWRSASGFHQRQTLEGTTGQDSYRYYDEPQLLWGTHGEATDHGFTICSDGEQGLTHVIPLELQSIPFVTDRRSRYRPLRLHVRRYIKIDQETGVASITFSRLLNITAQQEATNE